MQYVKNFNWGKGNHLTMLASFMQNTHIPFCVSVCGFGILSANEKTIFCGPKFPSVSGLQSQAKTIPHKNCLFLSASKDKSDCTIIVSKNTLASFFRVCGCSYLTFDKRFKARILFCFQCNSIGHLGMAKVVHLGIITC